jgi:hypothetical protein
MITIHEFKTKYFLTEADAPPPPGGGAPPPPPGGGAPPPPPPGGDLGGLGGGLGGASPPPPPPGGDLGGLGGSLGGAAGGATQTAVTDIKKLNAWDLLEKYFGNKTKTKDPLEAYT